jgi:hypothetical protein
MMIGSIDNCFQRLRTLLPRWFGDTTPILAAVLRGAASLLSSGYDLIGYAKRQTRIKTATEGWLDYIAHDFFGNALRRQVSQTDAAFRQRILASLFRERATRPGLVKLITDLTGHIPTVFEPSRPLDAAAYGLSRYGQGRYGTRGDPFQAWVTVYRSHEATLPPEAGFYQLSRYAQARYAAREPLQGALTDAALLAAVHQVKPVGTVIWVQLV